MTHMPALSLRTSFSVLTAALLLAGCGAVVHTPYQQPAFQVPERWQGETAVAAHAPTSQTAHAATGHDWWRRFDDPVLINLVEQAIARNNDLAVAAIRVRRAQLQAGLAQDNRLPQLSASGQAGTSRRIDESARWSESDSASASVKYELDLWGRLFSLHDSARWEALATEEDRRSAELALIGSTMDLYWQASYNRQRLQNSEASIAHARTTLDLVRAQFDAGAVSPLEVAEAEQNLYGQEASHQQLQQDLQETLNALSILFDAPPGGQFDIPARLPDTALPDIAPGLPAGLLARRPDLQAAELRLRRTLSSSDAVRASYYPSISLTGSLGSSSTALSSVLNSPVATLGIGINLPFLQWNQMNLNIAASKAEYEEAVVGFRQTLYVAMSEVDNALSARQQLASQGQLLAQTLRSARQAEALYEVRYRLGAVPLRSWLDAQEKRRTAEINVAQNRFNQYSNMVTLYKALGGDTDQEPIASADASGLR